MCPLDTILLGIPAIAVSHALLRKFVRLETLTWVTEKWSFFYSPNSLCPTSRSSLRFTFFKLRAPKGAKDTESITIPYSQRQNGPCKFPPPHRRRFSLIADRSPCWVINVSYGDRRKSNGSGVKGRSRPEEENNQMGERRKGEKIGQQTTGLTDF